MIQSWSRARKRKWGSFGVPVGLDGVVAIAAGRDFAMALKYDGTVVMWKDTSGNQPVRLDNVVAIAAEGNRAMALKYHYGTVLSYDWLDERWHQLVGLSNVVSIAPGYESVLALMQNDAVVSVFKGFFESDPTNLSVRLSGVVSLAEAESCNVALMQGGYVVEWNNMFGETTYETNISPNVKNVVAIAGYHDGCLAVKKDGTVVACGPITDHQLDVPVGLGNVVAVAAGYRHILALKLE